jgi:hypothetical protein
MPAEYASVGRPINLVRESSLYFQMCLTHHVALAGRGWVSKWADGGETEVELRFGAQQHKGGSAALQASLYPWSWQQLEPWLRRPVVRRDGRSATHSYFAQVQNTQSRNGKTREQNRISTAREILQSSALQVVGGNGLYPARCLGMLITRYLVSVQNQSQAFVPQAVSRFLLTSFSKDRLKQSISMWHLRYRLPSLLIVSPTLG